MGQNMTTQLLIEKVREQIGPLHSQSEQAVAAAMKILRGAQTEPPAQPTDEKFSGRNITLEEYKALPREEKSRYHDEAEELNWRWVQKQLNSLQAKWIMVVDGQVVSHGATLKNFPGREDIVKICERTGKYPFAFFSPRIFAIEELSNPWHTTKDAGDAYPALSISLLGNNNRVQTEADFDTGVRKFNLLKRRVSFFNRGVAAKSPPHDHPNSATAANLPVSHRNLKER
jgi:hypothetical protein